MFVLFCFSLVREYIFDQHLTYYASFLLISVMHVPNNHFYGDFCDFCGDFVGDFGDFSYSSHRK